MKVKIKLELSGWDGTDPEKQTYKACFCEDECINPDLLCGQAIHYALSSLGINQIRALAYALEMQIADKEEQPEEARLIELASTVFYPRAPDQKAAHSEK